MTDRRRLIPSVRLRTGALPVRSIWFGRTWKSTLKELAEGVVFGLLTAGVFGWLWP